MTESNATTVAATLIVILFILQTELFLAYAYWKIVTLFLEGERKMKLLSKLKSTSSEGKSHAGDDSAVNEPKFNEKEKRVIKKAVAITLCFTFCWTLTVFKVRKTYAFVILTLIFIITPLQAIVEVSTQTPVSWVYDFLVAILTNIAPIGNAIILCKFDRDVRKNVRRMLFLKPEPGLEVDTKQKRQKNIK